MKAREMMMNRWQGVRVSLSQARILDSERNVRVDLEWPSRGIWSCENAPIGDPFYVDRKLGVYPVMRVGAVRYIVRRKLLTNVFFRNSYEIQLVSEDGRIAAMVILPGGIFKQQQISYAGDRYALQRMNFFRFDYRVFRNDVAVVHLMESTPFLTFSSRREFAIDVSSEVDAELVGLAFFLSHNQFF